MTDLRLLPPIIHAEDRLNGHVLTCLDCRAAGQEWPHLQLCQRAERMIDDQGRAHRVAASERSP